MSGVVGPKKPAAPSVHSALAGMGVLSGEAPAVQPTPGPWSDPCTFGLTKFEVQGDGKKVAVFERLEDAKHAVKCVNAFETLVDALETMLEQILVDTPEYEGCVFINNARAAIARSAT